MGGYVAFGDVRSLALWERLVHGQRARMVHGIRIPWYRIERVARREVAPELQPGVASNAHPQPRVAQNEQPTNDTQPEDGAEGRRDDSRADRRARLARPAHR